MDEGGSHPGFFRNLKSLFGKGNSDKVTEEEIISMVNEGHENGLLEANETELIHNIFEYGDKEAGDIMTHRKNIVAVDGTMKLKDALNYMLDQNYSRFPVYEENIDNIIGFLHFKDAVKANRDPKEQEKMIRELPNILRPARFIPETRNISDLLRTMQKQKLHFVIVVDEYGQTAGLVTMEDIIEEIVGNIQDEYDMEEEDIVELPDHSFIIRGVTPLEDVEEALGVSFGEDEIETLNGFLISILDRIPADDEHIVINHSGYRFAVQSIQNKVIQKVHVSKLPESTETE
ncbi:HlyC/CorC family transporter [Oscillospiraceae bacterium Marseille-Q3528]|nr:HlyC/CorC family transporter [Oscillospiraceae bacterium Marseille-Q3528]